MISFRYHVVSITAVFLALGLGVALGSTVRPTTVLTKRQLNGLRVDLNNARAEIGDLRNQVQGSSSVVKNLSARVIGGALVGRQLVFVRDGPSSSWEGGIRRAMSTATAQDVGTLTLTGTWSGPKATGDLSRIAAASGVTVADPGPGAAVMAAIGERLGTPQGADLLSALVKAGYARADAKTTGPWPPAGIAVVALTSGPSTTPESAALAAFGRGAGKATPTLVVAGTTDDLGAVAILRGGDLLPRMATFDSGSVDPTGIGPVLALTAAIDGHGGNFGNAPGLSYLPPV